MKKINQLNNSKIPVIVFDKKLEQFRDKVLFPEKLAKANEILKKSSILPPTYLIDGSYSIRSINICANTHIRGIFTSDKLYDFVTIPSDMRFKFSFEIQKWTENFDW